MVTLLTGLEYWVQVLFQLYTVDCRDVKADKFLWKRKRLNFCGSGSTLKKEAGSELESI